jgi:crotonobetainyl-CoA:carnitine CoA-transferase CaiB-like acyl-CoA transferase
VPYELFQARDRAIVVAVGTDRQWAACAQVFGLVMSEAGVPWPTNALRVAHRPALVAQLAATIATNNAAEWIRQLNAVGVPCGVVRTVPEALADVACDEISGVAPATGGTVRRPPPQLNEHGDALRQHGWQLFARHDL